MISQIIEAFKKNQHSKLIESVIAHIFEVINSEHVSSRIRPYFTKERINSVGVPFTGFELEPDNITQIKKLINALYYARLTFIDLENLDVRTLGSAISYFPSLWRNTVETASEAGYLITHLDVDLKELFKEELELILPHLIKVQKLAETRAQQTKAAIQPYPIANQIGEKAAITVDQLRPLGGDVDYNFLTQFSAVLPGYIHRLTQQLDKYSSQIKEKEPKLNQEKLAEIQNAARHLLNDIENLKGNNILVPLKFLNYIHIIRNLITLSMSTLEQIGELSESSQDLVRDTLSQIKYDVLPKLFGLIDKIEVNCMVNPGTLSTPLMKQIKQLYSKLIYIPSKLIDFKVKGEEFLHVEDSRFIELRLELAYKRIDTANKTLYKTEQARAALTAFFHELEKPEYKNLSIHQLPAQVKKQLIEQYKIFKPYVDRLNIDLSEQITASLLAPETWSSYLTRPWNLINGVQNLDQVSQVLAKKNDVSTLIDKNEKTQVFHIQLNRDLIDSVYKNAELALYPYSRQTNVFTTDETLPLGIQVDEFQPIVEKSQLQTLKKNIYTLQKLITSGSASQEHLALNQLDTKPQKRLDILYNKLRPYLAYLVPTEQKDSLQNVEQYLTAVLANKTAATKDMPAAKMVTKLLERGLTFLEQTISSWPVAEDCYYDLEQKAFLDEHAAAAFLEKETKRLKFEKNDNNNDRFLKNPNQLTADQALELCEWYRNKHNKFEVAQQAYEDFLKLLQIHRSKNKHQTPRTLSFYDSKQPNIYHIHETTPFNISPEDLQPALVTDPHGNILLKDLEQLTATQTIKLYNFYSNKYNDFQVARHAYAKFNQILKEHDIQANIQNIVLLDEKLKEQCANLYATFQPYFVCTASQSRTKEMLDFDHVLIDLLSNKPVNAKDVFAIPFFKEAENCFTQIEATWREKKQRFMSLTRKKVTDETAFVNLLQTHNIQGSMEENIAALDDQVKTECRNLYNVFQSYFVCAAPEKYKKDILKFDKFLTAALSKKTIDTNVIPAIDLFEVMDKYFTKYFDKMSTEWYRKKQQYIKTAKVKLAEENKATSLTLNLQKGERAYHLLKDTQISKSIFEFRSALYGIRDLFNQPMRDQLNPQKATGIPFPEMEDPFLKLAESMQVRAIKDMYNCLYHIEGIATELETLQNYNLHDSYFLFIKKIQKCSYVKTLLQVHGHINEILQLSQRLATDPHYSFITQELVSKAQNLYAVVQEHSFAYQKTPEQISGPGAIQQNSLWHTLMAFYLGPNHIRSLKNKNYQTTEELNKLYKRAERATLTVEAIISNSHSYLQLFLQSPRMLLLYQELTQKLNEFTTTAHDSVLNNVDKVGSSIFTPLLCEADHWETKLGLAPGSLSEPLRHITNEFYKGFLHPLDLPSEEHIGLICDKKPLQERTKIINKKIAKTKEDIQRAQEEHADLAMLYDYVKEYKRYVSPDLVMLVLPTNTFSFTFEECTKRLCELYKKVLPILAQLRDTKKICIEESPYDDKHVLDDLCNEQLNAYDPQFTEIEDWITASYHYVQGLLSTYQMRLDTATEQLKYLTELDKIQDEENQTFIHDYTTEAFDKHLDRLCNRQIGLQFTDEEYRSELCKELLTFKTEIIAQSETAQDINLTINRLLQEKIGHFERKHYEEYYQLDRVQVVLSQIKGYLSDVTEKMKKNQNSLALASKSQAPITEKTKLINTLHRIATNTPEKVAPGIEINIPEKILSVSERFKKIREKVKDPNFERIFLSSNKHMDTLSFAYLKMCFLSLLETLNIYTSTRKKLFNNINEAVDKPHQLDELIVKFGLFAQPVFPVTDKSQKLPEMTASPVAN